MGSRFRKRYELCVLLVVALAPALVGCGRATGPGEAYVLAEEPAGARGVLESRAALAEAASPEPLVVEGRIGGAEGFVWDPGRAAFTIVDLTAEDASHAAAAHQDDGCPFCRAKQKKVELGTALVQIVDARAEVVPIDARELLGLSEGQTVVLRGQGHIDDLGHLSIQADKIFVRR